MNYIKASKEAWEEAFSHRKNGWGEDAAENLQSKPDFYINPTGAEGTGMAIKRYCRINR